MACTFIPDAQDFASVGLHALLAHQITRIPGRMSVGNPYVPGGVTFGTTELDAALVTAGFGAIGATIDDVGFAGPSPDTTVHMRRTSAGLVAAFARVYPGLTSVVEEAVVVDPVTGVSAPIANLDLIDFPLFSMYATGVLVPITSLVPAGVAPVATGEVAFDPATGVFTTLLADAITDITCNYTRGPSGMPGEYGIVDLSAAAKSCPCVVICHVA